MEEVIERMKAAAELEPNEEFAAGLEAGKHWAKRCATPKQLRKLEKNYDPSHGLCGDPPVIVFRLINGKVEDLDELREFWESALGEQWKRIDDTSYAEGFIEGALEIWQVVQDRI